VPKLPLHRSQVTGFLDQVLAHGVPGVMRGVALYVGQLTNFIPDRIFFRF